MNCSHNTSCNYIAFAWGQCILFFNQMKIYRQRTKSEVNICSWFDKKHALTDIKRLQFFNYNIILFKSWDLLIHCFVSLVFLIAAFLCWSIQHSSEVLLISNRLKRPISCLRFLVPVLHEWELDFYWLNFQPNINQNLVIVSWIWNHLKFINISFY